MKTIPESHQLIKGAECIVCPRCGDKSTRQGAQDYCDVYLCNNKHLTRIKIGQPRKVWEEKKE